MEYKITFEYSKPHYSEDNTYYRDFNIGKISSDIDIVFTNLKDLYEHISFFNKEDNIDLLDDTYRIIDISKSATKDLLSYKVKVRHKEDHMKFNVNFDYQSLYPITMTRFTSEKVDPGIHIPISKYYKGRNK